MKCDLTGILEYTYCPTKLYFQDFLSDQEPGRDTMLIKCRFAVKAVTLGGYRSAMRRNNIPVPTEYGDSMKTLFSAIKRLQADNGRIADVRSSGKCALTYSRYQTLCSSTLARNDGGFAHLFLTTQWSLMCCSKSVETIRTSHLVSVDDSIGRVLQDESRG